MQFRPSNISTGFQNADQSQTDFLIKFLEDASRLPTVVACFETQLDWLNIKQGHHILDVGCGIGDQARAIARRVGAGGRVVGTDFSENMINFSRTRHSNCNLPLEFLVADAHQQPFEDETFDRIRVERVLMYIENPEAVFRELLRLLKPDGRLIIFDFDWDATVVAHPDRKLTRKVVQHLCDSLPSGRIGANLFRHFNEFGFTNTEIKPFGYVTPLEFSRRVCEGMIQTGVENNTFNKEEIDNWWATLERDNNVGNFFMSFQGFLLIGTKCESQ